MCRALDADQSIQVLVDDSEDYLLAELTFSSGHIDAAMKDLVELCADHGVCHELIATTR